MDRQEWRRRRNTTSRPPVIHHHYHDSTNHTYPPPPPPPHPRPRPQLPHHPPPKNDKNQYNNTVRIIHVHEPKVIKTDVTHFKEIVQKLTGKPQLPPTSPPRPQSGKRQKITNDRNRISPTSVLTEGRFDCGCYNQADQVAVAERSMRVRSDQQFDPGGFSMMYSGRSEYNPHYHQLSGTSLSSSVNNFDHVVFGHHLM